MQRLLKHTILKKKENKKTKNEVEYHYAFIRMTRIKMTDHGKRWEEHTATRILTCDWSEGQIVQRLGKTVYLLTGNGSTYSHKNLSWNIFIITENYQQPKCPSPSEWINLFSFSEFIPTKRNASQIKRKEKTLTHDKDKSITISKRIWTQKNVYCM